MAPAHIERLRQLRLIEANGTSCRLTALGRQRLGTLPQPVKLVTGNALDEIERILAKFDGRGHRPVGSAAVDPVRVSRHSRGRPDALSTQVCLLGLVLAPDLLGRGRRGDHRRHPDFPPSILPDIGVGPAGGYLDRLAFQGLARDPEGADPQRCIGAQR